MALLLLPVAAACTLPLVFVHLHGEGLDTDYLAHLMWARQADHNGSLPVVSEDGVFDDPAVYYPNTVPKPLVLGLVYLLDLARARSAHLVAQTVVFAVVLWSCSLIVLRLSRSIRAAIFSAVLLGLHPTALFLAQRGNPVLLCVALVYLAALLSERRVASVPMILCALVRLEGALYMGEQMLRKRRFALMAVALPAVALIWLLANRLMCGSWLWSVEEVRYVTAAMGYSSPAALAFWILVGSRALLVVGPVLLYGLLRRIRSFPWAVSAAANLLLLWVSAMMGSLVLGRYVDQVMLICIPWAVAGLFSFTTNLPRHYRLTLRAAALLTPAVLWLPATGGWRFELALARELDSIVLPPGDGRLAVNELLVPRIALANGIHDPRDRFVALDRAAWEDADLRELGVVRSLVVSHPLYYPDHTRDYVDQLPAEMKPETLEISTRELSGGHTDE